MSLVTLIRDYVDVANSSEQLDGYTFSSLVYYTFAFLFTVIKQAIIYCFTFHWFQDISYFCFTCPSFANPIGQQPLSAFTNSLLEMNTSIPFGSVTKSSGIENQPLANLLAFSDSGFSTNIGIVFLGFLNGCFSCMHFSAGNFVTIQRMLVQGIPAGLCSAFGTALGQFSFLICIVFGFRGLLFPWLALEPFHFLLGAGILLTIASSTAQDRRTPTVQWSAKSSLLMYAFTSFALTWCEQTAIFQWIGNISFGPEPTFLETTPFREIIHTTFGDVQQLIQNSSYLLTFFLGNLAGAAFIGYAVQRLFEWLLRYKKIAIYYGLIKQANLPLATLIFAFGFGSLPYYGFDYLLTNGFGFVPQERFFQQTLFSPTNLVSKTVQTKEPSQGRLEDQLALLFTLEGEKSKSFAVDTTPFDDGQYLKTSQKRPQTFEDLNYRGEHLWTNRLSRISNMREQANQTQSSFLGPIFSWMRSFLWGDGTATSLATPSPSSAKQISTLGSHNNNIPSHSNPLFISTEDKAAYPFTSPTYPKGQQAPHTEQQEQIDNYVKEFDRQFDKGFSNFYNADPYSLIEVEDQWQEKRIKEKCYTNPIYTFLLNTEIDTFLKRQPNSHWLSPQEEILLLKKRQLLKNYYDTLALTNQAAYPSEGVGQQATSESLGQLLRIPRITAVPTKSYANTTYNHQFKGTLKVARRLFSVKKLDLDYKHPRIDEKTVLSNSAKMNYPSAASQADSKQSRQGKDEKTKIIKFDQPLYLKERNTIETKIFHEELDNDIKESQQNSSSTSSPLLVSKADLTQTNVERLVKKSEQKETENKKSNIFLLEQAEPLPLYVSWDDQLRKLIVTNRFQNRGLAGYTFSEFPINNKISTFFTSWPISNPFFNQVLADPKDEAQLKPEISEENNINSMDPLHTKHIEYNKTLYPEGFDDPSAPFSSDTRSEHLTTPSGLDLGNKPETFGYPKGKRRNPSISEKEIALQTRRVSNQNHFSEQADDKNWIKKGISNGETTLSDNRSRDDETPVNENKKTYSLTKSSSSERTGLKNLLQNFVDSITRSFFHQSPKNRYLFQTESIKEPITSDMVNALLQWQKLIKENKQLSKEDKQVAKEKISHWPENVNHSNWSNELIENDIDFDEPVENIMKKQTLLWEFIPPNHGGFIWPGSNLTN